MLMFLLLCFLANAPSFHAQSYGAKTPDTRGRQFIFGIPSNVRQPDNIIMMITGHELGSNKIDISIPGLGFRRTQMLNGLGQVRMLLPTQAAAHGCDVQNGTVWVSSTKDVSVAVLNDIAKSTEAFLAIPVDALGKEYFVASYDPLPEEFSEVMITSTQDNTRIKITFQAPVTYHGMSYAPGDIYTFTLNRLKSVQFQSHMDMTGTRIQATASVAVVSGNTCTLVPGRLPRCDHLVEMVPPVPTWGSMFTLMPFLNRTAGYIFRVVAARARTSVQISGASIYLQNQGEFQEFNVPGDTITTISSNQPIMALQFAKGRDSDEIGDPFMTIVPPVEQYIKDRVTFGTFNISGGDYFHPFVNLMISSPGILSMINVNSIPSMTGTQYVPASGKIVSYGGSRSMALMQGIHTLMNPAPGNSFTAITYGIGPWTSYGFPTAYNLKTLICTRNDPTTGSVVEYACPQQPDTSNPCTGIVGGIPNPRARQGQQIPNPNPNPRPGPNPNPNPNPRPGPNPNPNPNPRPGPNPNSKTNPRPGSNPNPNLNPRPGPNPNPNPNPGPDLNLYPGQSAGVPDQGKGNNDGRPVPGSPGMGMPGMGVPGMGIPGMGVPGMGMPGMGMPGMGVPGMGIPGMGVPGMGIPGMGIPGMGIPGMVIPGTGMGNPGVGVPIVPGVGLPGQGQGGPGFGRVPGNGWAWRTPPPPPPMLPTLPDKCFSQNLVAVVAITPALLVLLLMSMIMCIVVNRVKEMK
ncbi:uncharacterized protein LOC117109602 [Anneissia japonica]|uniref:uncharacterized protein LOC117109602 n=1 Tax=Anneissia japonica TaxID=1529436 RepID=UPI0014258764|nr:uncharacterized protein LOC117109602 [Anneissia japonica]